MYTVSFALNEIDFIILRWLSITWLLIFYAVPKSDFSLLKTIFFMSVFFFIVHC